MSDCRDTVDQLPGYVDNALTPDAHAVIAQHLTLCARCRQEEATQRAAASVLRQRAPMLRSVAAPPGLRSRCEAALLAAHPPAPRGWVAALVPAALATLLVAATGFALLRFATEHSNTVLAAELMADHVKCFRLFGSGTARPADPAAVEAMLRVRYGWDVHVPPSSDAEELRLDGARKCAYAEGTIPHVMYQAHGQNVSLFILEGVTRPSGDVTTLGHRARIWSRGRNTYILVSSAAAGTLSDVVGYVQREAH